MAAILNVAKRMYVCMYIAELEASKNDDDEWVLCY